MRTGPEFGHIYDHMSVVYEFENGVKCFSHCRQKARLPPTTSATTSWARAATCDVMRHRITGPNAWRYPVGRAREDVDMYQQEHNELFASIRRGKPINDGDWMAKSTLMAIMGRMACYTGQVVTWDQALNSREDLTPPSYRWDQPMPRCRPGGPAGRHAAFDVRLRYHRRPDGMASECPAARS